MTEAFTKKEIKSLCDLYMEGELSRKEERMLFLLLDSLDNISPEQKLIRNLMIAEKKIFINDSAKKPRHWIYSGIVASLLVLCSISIPLIWRSDFNEGSYIVWQNGEKITGERAKEMVEEKQFEDMEMIRKIMRQQREMLKRNFASVNMEEYDY